MTGSPISDMIPILVACGATIFLRNKSKFIDLERIIAL